MEDQIITNPEFKERYYDLWTWMQDCGYFDRVMRAAQIQLQLFGDSRVMSKTPLDEASSNRIRELLDAGLAYIASSDVRHNVPPQGKFDDMLFNRLKIAMREVTAQNKALQSR